MKKNHIFFLLGATGDLAKRKIYPAIYQLYKRNHIYPGNFKLIGVSYDPLTEKEYTELVADKMGVSDVSKIFNIYYEKLDFRKDPFDLLKKYIEKNSDLCFYLATIPSLFKDILKKIKDAQFDNDKLKVILEKPYGESYADTVKINLLMNTFLTEKQIYRIDHYLGKPAIKDLIRLRKQTCIKEKWNCRYIKAVNFILSETDGIEERLDFYKETGTITDIVQNHVFQLLLLVSMEEPETIADIHNKKQAIAENILKSFDTCSNYFGRKQYLDFKTETLFYGRLFIDTPRWENVPFNIVSGKRMTERITEIAIEFYNPDYNMEIELYPLREGALQEYASLIKDCFDGKQQLFLSARESEQNWIFGEKIKCAWNMGKAIGKYQQDKVSPEEVLHWIDEEAKY